MAVVSCAVSRYIAIALPPQISAAVPPSRPTAIASGRAVPWTRARRIRHMGHRPAPGADGELLAREVPLPPPFRVPLPVPPVRRPVDGVIEITQRVAEVEILPGVRTSVFGYDGTFPGPTLETRRGEPVVVRHRNELPVPTAVHLHGGHTPPEHDGWPLDLVLPPDDPGG